MSVFWIDTPAMNSIGKSMGYPFECDCASVAEFAEKLAKDRIVAGNKLITVDDGRGGRMVQRRKPCAITAAGIAHMAEYEKRIWEPDDDAPAG